MRTLRLKKPPMTGPDVKALQKLLTAKGFKVKADGVYGQVTADTVLKAKKALSGYPLSILNRNAGRYFLKRLTEYKPPKPPTADGRKRFVAALDWALKNGRQIGYSQSSVRLLATLWRKWRLPFKSDCSGIGIILAKWSGNPSPSGSWLWGNTTSMLSALPHIRLAQVLPGDPIILSNPAHVVYALEPGSNGDPLTFSHGGPDGNPPHTIRLSAEKRYHPGLVTPLRLKVNP